MVEALRALAHTIPMTEDMAEEETIKAQEATDLPQQNLNSEANA